MCKAAAATAGALDCVEVTVVIFPEANSDVTVVVVVGMIMATIRGLLAPRHSSVGHGGTGEFKKERLEWLQHD